MDHPVEPGAAALEDPSSLPEEELTSGALVPSASAVADSSAGSPVEPVSAADDPDDSAITEGMLVEEGSTTVVFGDPVLAPVVDVPVLVLVLVLVVSVAAASHIPATHTAAPRHS